MLLWCCFCIACVPFAFLLFFIHIIVFAVSSIEIQIKTKTIFARRWCCTMTPGRGPRRLLASASLTAMVLLLAMNSQFAEGSEGTFTAVNLQVLPGTAHDSVGFVDIDTAPNVTDLVFSWRLLCNTDQATCMTEQAPSTVQLRLFKVPSGNEDQELELVADSGQRSVDGDTFQFEPTMAATATSMRLNPNSRYQWNVYFDTTPAAAAEFHTTLDPADWDAAQWIGGGTLLRGKAGPFPSRVQEATMYATALGCFSATLNGQPTTTSVLDPGFSTIPPHRLLYRALNVTSAFNSTPGAVNTLDVSLGMYVRGRGIRLCDVRPLRHFVFSYFAHRLLCVAFVGASMGT